MKPLDITCHSQRAQELALKFSERIIGQATATTALVNVLDKFYSGFYDRSRPIASLLFLGPTGVGKTATVEAFVEGLFGTPIKMFKIDCAEFQHSHEIAKLVGSPPGYLGHRESGSFINTKRIQEITAGASVPFVVILLDEIEKASDALWTLLLGILDKGTLTLGTNEIIDLKNSVIVMTSNVGSRELAAKAGRDVIGFEKPDFAPVNDEELRKIAVESARRKFTPEFLNRLDDIVMFNSLTQKNLEDILEVELGLLRLRIVTESTIKVLLSVSPAAKKQILTEGYDPRYNARELKRVVERRVASPLARVVASGQVNHLDIVVVDYKEEFTYNMEKSQ